MTILLTQEKANKLNSAVTRLILSCERPTTQEVAQVRGLITPPARRAWRSCKFAPFLVFFSFVNVESWATAHG